MLDEDIREAALLMAQRGQSVRAIAKALSVSRDGVRSVLQAGVAQPPRIARPSALDGLELQIDELRRACGGNLVRVHEELAKLGVQVGYTTLTDWCRNNHIGRRPKRPAGQYTFDPGEEMQHDTSPHRVLIGGKLQQVQCASLVLCYSRKIHAQVFHHWRRLQARIFLSEAIERLGGAASRCMIDNSSVVLASGSGKGAVICAELASLAERFGFVFAAHAVGDADRSARVERPFHYIEHNFYPGRTFADLDDLNAQLADWCERDGQRKRRTLQASPLELWVAERPTLQPLPVHGAPIFASYDRIVDLTGCVNLHANRYSAPPELVGRQLCVRESKNKVALFLDSRKLCEHPLLPPGAGRRHTLPAHLHPAGQSRTARAAEPCDEERLLRAADPLLGRYVDGLRARQPGRAVLALRRLQRLRLEHSGAAMQAALEQALQYGMFDVGRLERMVLRHSAGEIFGEQALVGLLDPQGDDDDEHT